MDANTKNQMRKVAEDSATCGAEARDGTQNFNQDKYKKCMTGKGHSTLFEK